MKDWLKDKSWADMHISEIRNVIRKVAGKIVSIEIASSQEDTKNATDYNILVEFGSIGCRIRRPGVWPQYHDITIRKSRRSGARTELDKIKDGNPKWYLYGWDSSDKSLHAWVFFDVDILRSSGLLDGNNVISNRDGGSNFLAINVRELAGIKCLIGYNKPVESYIKDIMPINFILSDFLNAHSNRGYS
jgi:hypothetical protein